MVEWHKKKRKKRSERALDPTHIIHTHRKTKIQNTPRSHALTMNGELDKMALALYVAMPIVNGIQSKYTKTHIITYSICMIVVMPQLFFLFISYSSFSFSLIQTHAQTQIRIQSLFPVTYHSGLRIFFFNTMQFLKSTLTILN